MLNDPCPSNIQDTKALVDIQDTDALFKRAKEQAKNASDEYQETIELYYIARYWVSVFESYVRQLPTQVLNEYRNAFDHFARYIAGSGDVTKGDDNHRNLYKMKGHIQRAVLDICKILCIHFGDFYEEKISPNTNYLRLVTNGRFLKELTSKHSEAKKKLLEAKQLDSSLGEEVNTNEEVRKAYCDAVFLFKSIEDSYNDNIKDIIKAQDEFSNIHNRGANLSRQQQFWVAATIAAISGIISFLLGMFLK